MRNGGPALAAILVTFSGCLGAEQVGTTGGPWDDFAPWLRSGDAAATGEEALRLEGRVLSSPNEHPPGFDCLAAGLRCPPAPPCNETTCERVPFRFEVPPEVSLAGASLSVRIQWDTRDEDYTSIEEYLGLARLHMDLRVFDASGKEVADGAESGHYASVARFPAAAGSYIAQVHALWGTGGYRLAVQLEPEPRPSSEGAAQDLLPDAVVLPPMHLRVEHPLAREAAPALAAAGDRGCGPDETLDRQALRCLRFAGAVGNAGTGALELHLRASEAADGLAAPDGRWDQRVFRSDGSHRDVPAVAAQWHVTHGHFHALGVSVATVHTYDLEAGERGSAVAQGQKTGYCFIDGGLLDLGRAGPPVPVYFGPGCCYYWGFCELDLLQGDDFVMGIGAGWFDVYPWWRADQYVDVSDLPDGVYELVFRGNPDAWILESNPANNEASTIFRLTGDDVEELESRGPFAPYVVNSA